MAAARRRVVYVVARNLIVLFVLTSRLVVVIRFRRGGSGARGFAFPASRRCASVKLEKDASDGVGRGLRTGNSYTSHTSQASRAASQQGKAPCRGAH